MVPMFSVLGSERLVHGKLDLADAVERVEQLSNRRFAEFRDRRNAPSCRARSIRSAARLSIPAPSWFSVGSPLMMKLRAARILRRMISARRCCVPRRPRTAGRNCATPRFEQTLRGVDHAGDDALGIAGAAAPDEFVVFARAEEGRDGIHVGGERHHGLVAELREDVEAARFHFHALHASIDSGRRASPEVRRGNCQRASSLSVMDSISISARVSSKTFIVNHLLGENDREEKRRHAVKAVCLRSR